MLTMEEIITILNIHKHILETRIDGEDVFYTVKEKFGKVHEDLSVYQLKEFVRPKFVYGFNVLHDYLCYKDVYVDPDHPACDQCNMEFSEIYDLSEDLLVETLHGNGWDFKRDVNGDILEGEDANIGKIAQDDKGRWVTREGEYGIEVYVLEGETWPEEEAKQAG